MNNQMFYKGYTASIEFDLEDKIIIGRVINISDIISFHATSIDEFEQAFHTSVDDYLAACSALGQQPEKPVSGHLMLRIDPKVHAAAAKAANQVGLSMNTWVEQLLSQTLHLETES